MTDLHASTIDRRQVGPVTMATGGGAAVATLIAWGLSFAGIELASLEQGALTLVLIMVAGWSVRPAGRRSK